MNTQFAKSTFACAVSAAVLFSTAACGSSDAGSGSDSSDGGGSSSSLTADADIAALVPDKIAEAGVLKVGTAVYPPAVIVEGGAPPTGWDVETIKDAAAIMGLEADINVMAWDALIPGLEANRFDVGLGEMAILPERTEVVTFVHHHDSGNSFIVKVDSDMADVDTVEQICGLHVSALLGSSNQNWMEQYSDECESMGLEPITISTFKDQPTANLAVLEGRVDASYASTSQAVYLVEQAGDDLKVVPNNFEPQGPVGIAIAKSDDSDAMAEALRAAMQKLIDDGRLQEILDEFNGGLGAVDQAKIVPDPAA